jgi:hypothetical protein
MNTAFKIALGIIALMGVMMLYTRYEVGQGNVSGSLTAALLSYYVYVFGGLFLLPLMIIGTVQVLRNPVHGGLMHN